MAWLCIDIKYLSKREGERMTVALVGISALFASIYSKIEENTKVLSLILWGATLMWLVDVIYGVYEEGNLYFQSLVQNWKDDSLLGLCAIGLGLIIWKISIKNKREH